MYRFQEWLRFRESSSYDRGTLYEEGAFDANLFKAVYAYGGPAAGKSFASNAFKGMGFHVLQSDDLYEFFLSGMGAAGGGRTPTTNEPGGVGERLGLPTWGPDALPSRWSRKINRGQKMGKMGLPVPDTTTQMTGVDPEQQGYNRDTTTFDRDKNQQPQPADDGDGEWKPFKGYGFGPAGGRRLPDQTIGNPQGSPVVDRFNTSIYRNQEKMRNRAGGIHDYRAGIHPETTPQPYDQPFNAAGQETLGKTRGGTGDDFTGGIKPRSGLPILIESTGKSKNFIRDYKMIDEYGYDQYGVLVYTDVVSALVNNAFRGFRGGRKFEVSNRIVAKDKNFIITTHEQVRNNMQELKRVFGDRLYVIDTTRPLSRA
ncbi:MAG: hypothetical protein ACRDV0_10780, partial [Acidimicrobiales bacterium]